MQEHIPGISESRETTWRPLIRSSLDFPLNDYDHVLQTCLRWIARTYEKSFGKSISQSILTSPSNDFSPPGHRFAWLTIDSPADGVNKLFSAKIEHPDNDASRTWSVEFELAATKTGVVFGLRSAVFGRDTNSAPQTIPRLVSELASRGASHAGISLDFSGKVISNDIDVYRLAEFVNSSQRVMPLIIISEIGENLGWPAQIQSIATKTKGLAIAVSMTNSATYLWRSLIGPRLNVYRGATRIYLPLSSGQLYAPIFLLENTRDDLSQSIEAWAEKYAQDSSIRSPAWIDRHADYETARQLAASQHRKILIADAKKNNEIDSLITAYEHELSSITEKLERERIESRTWVAEIDELTERFDDLDRDHRHLKYKYDQLRSQNFQENKSALNKTMEYPSSLEKITDWYEESGVEEKLFISSRGLREAEESLYEEPFIIYRALDILANEYAAMKLAGGDITARDIFNKALIDIGMQIEFAGGQTTLAKKEYRVDYRGRKLTTDWHLTKGGGRDPRYCARIYFTWDIETQRCIVGWLPSHLDNTLS